MKKSILLIFLAAIVLAGCANGLSKSELFEKKQECLQYTDEIKEEASNKYPLLQIEDDLYVNEIFYNSKYNSCLYHSEAIMWDEHTHEIRDFLSKEVIMGCVSNVIDGDWTCYDWTTKKLTELMWE